MPIIDNFRRIKEDERGAIVVIFCLALPTLLGVVGISIDYGRALRVRSVERKIADATALLVANAETAAAAAEANNFANAELKAILGTSANNYQVSGHWIDGSNYRLTISADINMALSGLIPGMPRKYTVATTTTVSRTPPVYDTAPPKMVQLSPEAVDYNQVFFYCYSSDPSRQKDPDRGRRGLTPIADNATPPSNYDQSKMPKCEKNEAPSYALRNVRDARQNKSRWNENGNDTYIFYTDVTIDTGTLVQNRNMKAHNIGSGQEIDITKKPILETILCESEEKCVPKSAGGVIPDRTLWRSPQVAAESCKPGKFMYYGWEDRPGGDQDFDDIRLIISCPVPIKIKNRNLRFVE